MPQPINVREIESRATCSACKAGGAPTYAFATLPDRKELLRLCQRCMALVVAGALGHERMTAEELLRWAGG